MLRLSAVAMRAEDEEREAAIADWPPSAAITGGVVYSMVAVGVSLGPVVVGRLYDATGTYWAGFEVGLAKALAKGAKPPLPPTHLKSAS